MTQYYSHIAQQGERWDTLAYIYWGDASLVPQLIADNPQLPWWCESLKQGWEVLIRVEPPVVTQITINNLPPWKR